VIDIHTYILPNIDSGPEEVDGFLKMARSLADQGVQSVVATPLYDSDQEFMKHHLFLYVNAANELLTNSYIPLRVLPGQLVPLSPQLLRNYERNQLLTLNHTDKYLFLSLPESDVSFCETMSEISFLRLITPINICFFHCLNLMSHLILKRYCMIFLQKALCLFCVHQNVIRCSEITLSVCMSLLKKAYSSS